MKKFKVKTPNPNFAGKRENVQFYKGEAVAELPEKTVNVFKSWGYEVEEIVEKKAPAPKKAPVKKKAEAKENEK